MSNKGNFWMQDVDRTLNEDVIYLFALKGMYIQPSVAKVYEDMLIQASEKGESILKCLDKIIEIEKRIRESGVRRPQKKNIDKPADQPEDKRVYKRDYRREYIVRRNRENPEYFENRKKRAIEKIKKITSPKKDKRVWCECDGQIYEFAKMNEAISWYSKQVDVTIPAAKIQIWRSIKEERKLFLGHIFFKKNDK